MTTPTRKPLLADADKIKLFTAEINEQRKIWEQQAQRNAQLDRVLFVVVLAVLFLGFALGIFDQGRYAAIATFLTGGLIVLYRFVVPGEKARFKRGLALTAKTLTNDLRFDEVITKKEYDGLRVGYNALCQLDAEEPQGGGIETVMALYNQVNKQYGSTGGGSPAFDDWQEEEAATS